MGQIVLLVLIGIATAILGIGEKLDSVIKRITKNPPLFWKLLKRGWIRLALTVFILVASVSQYVCSEKASNRKQNIAKKEQRVRDSINNLKLESMKKSNDDHSERIIEALAGYNLEYDAQAKRVISILNDSVFAKQKKFHSESMGERSKPVLIVGDFEQDIQGSVYVQIWNYGDDPAYELEGSFKYDGMPGPEGVLIEEETVQPDDGSKKIPIKIAPGTVSINAKFNTKSGKYEQRLFAVPVFRSEWSQAYELRDIKNKTTQYCVPDDFPYERLSKNDEKIVRGWAKLQESGCK